MLSLQLAVGFVDCLDKLGEAGRFVDRPEPREAVTEQLDLTLGEQSDGDDPFLRQVLDPWLTCISINDGLARLVPTVTAVVR